MCNNNGHCRKFDAGTMCPSYRITRDEIASTRGRANTLRLALSGQIGVDGIADDAVHEALDLCVSCKGCKRDCPTGVDMAKMKIEHLHHYHAKHGLSIKDRLISRLPDYAPLTSALAPLFNLRDRLPGAAWLSEKLFGFAAKRSLPKWRRDTFWKRDFSQKQSGTNREFVLFADTFNAYFERENLDAAIRVLEAANYTVHIARGRKNPLCCGRTHLSVGDIDRAKAKMRELLNALLPFATRGVAIVGLEPSCLFTLRDEALSMGFGDDAELVAKHAVLLDTFLAREASGGKLDALKTKLKPATAPILVHGHCHQKAFDEANTTLKLLSLIPNANPTLIESSCCGMAGAFGYEASHYEASIAMAELSLLPAIRKAGDARVVADGTSCRHQVKDGVNREAHHAIRVLAGHLTS
jgi:Fe-S oxidoreductase